MNIFKTLSSMLMIVALVLAGSGPRAHAQGGPSAVWSFIPASSVIPDDLPDGEIFALGGQRALVVKQSPTIRAYHLVHEGESTLLFAEGDPAPGGGAFGDVVTGQFYTASPHLVFFYAYINVSDSTVTRLFRWENDTLTHLPIPEGANYDLTRNDGAGKFLAYRFSGYNREFWITDGLVNSPSIHLVGFEERGPGWYTIRNHDVAGITADGEFLIAEENASDPLGCVIDDVKRQIYIHGNPPTILAQSHYAVNDCEGTVIGDSVHVANTNSSGSVLVSHYNFTTDEWSSRLYDSVGAFTTVATSLVFPDIERSATRLTHDSQAIFQARAAGATDQKWYIGPSANDRFGGDFMSSFGQTGEVDNILYFHESGFALVLATLEDGSNVLALGQTNDGTAPAITSAEPPPGTNHQAYSFQFTASGSPAPTFQISEGELPPGLTLAADGLLSGTPTESGEFPITLQASNGVNPDASHEYTLVIEPRLPVIFIHGVAGSVLKSGNHTIWPSVFPQDVADLNLQTGPSNTEAVDVIRQYDVGGLGVEVQQFYAPFINRMTQQAGYIEFDLAGDRSRLTSNYLVTHEFTERPDFFVFPYDWRKPNASHISTLHTYIQRIRELHEGSKVNLVVHSMGGLVMRRYLLEHGSDDVENVVTVGSPIWGAPEVAHRLLTGTFYYVLPVDFINSPTMQEAIATMPAVHELLPSTLYLQNWGFPVFEELGHDFNGNGLRDEGYNTSQFRSMVDAVAEPYSPALNNVVFHTAAQDDWSNDDSPVKYLQIVGKQARDQTTVGVTVESKTVILPHAFSQPYPTLEFTQVLGQGDGTVPILSSRRLPEYLAPGTQIREIEESFESLVNGNPPDGQSAEHTKLMANTIVLDLITEFFDTPPTSPAPDESQQAHVMESSVEEVGADVMRVPKPPYVAFSPVATGPEIAVEYPLGTDLVNGMASKHFDRTIPGSSQQRVFTIRNVGTTHLTDLEVSITGTNSDDFSVADLDTTSLAPDTSTDLIVTYAPEPGTVANRAAVLHIASNDPDENPFNIALTGTTPPGSKRIAILGAGYLTVRDSQGRENTLLSEIAARQIPGIDFQYGGDEPWMNIHGTSDSSFVIADTSADGSFEIEIIESNNISSPVSLHRFRFTPGDKPWRLAILPHSLPEMMVDQNQDGNFTPEEELPATHHSEGGAVDSTAPTVIMEIGLTGGQIVVALSSSDGAQPAPPIRYSVDGGSIQTYTAPLAFAVGSARRLKIYAEDAAGNTSGLIETTVNPSLTIGPSLGGTITLAWPVADGYVLEESTSLANGSWDIYSAPVHRSGQQNSVLLGLNKPSVFYRLRSQRIER